MIGEAVASGLIDYHLKKSIFFIPQFYEKDDIMQELKVACWSGVKKFDEKQQTSLRSFLNSCITHHIYNIRRSIYLPNNPPCYRCVYFKDSECQIYEVDCQKIRRYRENLKKRQRLDKPLMCKEEYKIQDFKHQEDAILLDLSIKDKLTPYLEIQYEKLKNGEEIDKNLLKEIRKVTKEIIEDV